MINPVYSTYTLSLWLRLYLPQRPEIGELRLPALDEYVGGLQVEVAHVVPLVQVPEQQTRVQKGIGKGSERPAKGSEKGRQVFSLHPVGDALRELDLNGASPGTQTQGSSLGVLHELVS